MSQVEARQQRDTELVNATARENMWAGIGAGALTLCLQLAWRMHNGIDLVTQPVIIWSVIASLVLFGVLSVLRFSLDEWRDSLERRKMLAYMTDQALRIQEQDAQIRDLQTENKRINTRLRAAEFCSASSGARVVTAEETDTERILRNVERILQTWRDNLPYGRDYCKAMGLTRPEWEAAVMLMQKAGVMGKDNRQWVVVAKSYNEATMLVRERAGLRTRTEGSNFVSA